MSWLIEPLQALCDDFKRDIVDGPFGSNLKCEDYQTEGEPVLKIQNIREFRVEWKKIDYVTSSKFDELKRHSYREGDIVMTKLGDPLGVSAIVERNGEGLIVADLVRIRAQKINTKFLCYCLNAPEIRGFINSQSKGATRPRVRITTVRELPIPVPPLPEQERIVAILDEAFEGIATATAHAERNLHNARELFQSVLEYTFQQKGEDWVETTLGEVCENLDSRRVPITKSKRTSGEYPYYGASGVVDHVNDFIFDEDLLLVSEDGANLLARTYPIAFSVSGKIWVNNHAHVLRFPNLAAQRFMEFYLNSIKLNPYVSGMAQPKLNQKSLNGIPVPAPPVDQQNLIVQKLDALATETSRLEVIYQRKLDALDELKQSLLQRAFAGRL